MILERVNSGRRTKEQKKAEFTGYPNYYKDYEPTVTLPVTRNLTKQQEIQGKKLVQEMNHRFFVAGMIPSMRPEHTPLNQHHSCITSELERAAADLSIKINQMKLYSEGFSSAALMNPDMQANLIAFGSSRTLPQTITD